MIWYQVSYQRAIESYEINHFVGIPYPLNFPVFFSLISHVFTTFHEKLHLMCYELDHVGNYAVSKHQFKIRFGTIGHLTTEIILEVHPIDFSAIFH